MKKFFLIFSALVCLAEMAPGATIARWTFETSIPAGAPGAGTWITNIAAEVGNGTASGFHAGVATYSNPAGNGSAESFSVTTWAVGDLFQFVTDTTGSSGIGISFDQASSSTGPGRFDLAYSTDGISFTTFASSYVVQLNGAPNVAWTITPPPNSVYSYAFDLSTVPALDNAPTAYFRLIDSSTTSSSGGTVAATGTSRIDNFEVFAPVPEPGTVSLLVIGGLLLGFKFRRK